MRGGRAEHLGKLLEPIPHFFRLKLDYLFRPLNISNQVEGMFGIVRVDHDRPGGETNGTRSASTYRSRGRLRIQAKPTHDESFGGQ